jgi:hypothetical protein
VNKNNCVVLNTFRSPLRVAAFSAAQPFAALSVSASLDPLYAIAAVAASPFPERSVRDSAQKKELERNANQMGQSLTKAVVITTDNLRVVQLIFVTHCRAFELKEKYPLRMPEHKIFNIMRNTQTSQGLRVCNHTVKQSTE